MNAPSNKPKQFHKGNTAEAKDVCPTCKQRHNIHNYFYVNPTLEILD
jgi:hypothetical protein